MSNIECPNCGEHLHIEVNMSAPLSKPKQVSGEKSPFAHLKGKCESFDEATPFYQRVMSIPEGEESIPEGEELRSKIEKSV